MNRAAAIVAFGGTVALILTIAVLVPRFAFNLYDEGVYFYEGALWARGQTPYADYFVPQPPGIVMIGAASDLGGIGISGSRAVSLACSLVATSWATAA